MNGVSSDKKVITKGVPQGLVLGFLLYLPFINNIQKAGLKRVYAVFADCDFAVIMYCGETKELPQSHIDQGIIILDNWLRMIVLKQYITIANRNQPEIELNIKISGEKIKRNSSTE